MKQVKRPMSQSYIVGLLLAFAGGYLDVYTYVCRGGVFANAQTGNMAVSYTHLMCIRDRAGRILLLQSIWRRRCESGSRCGSVGDR